MNSAWRAHPGQRDHDKAAAETTLCHGDLREARMALVGHAGGGLLVLFVPTALSVYKPRGRARCGQRKAGRAA